LRSLVCHNKNTKEMRKTTAKWTSRKQTMQKFCRDCRENSPWMSQFLYTTTQRFLETLSFSTLYLIPIKINKNSSQWQKSSHCDVYLDSLVERFEWKFDNEQKEIEKWINTRLDTERKNQILLLQKEVNVLMSEKFFII
jgi:hypothetical protein